MAQASLAPSRRSQAGVRAWVDAHPDYAGLAAILLLGLALRTYFTLVWHPAITGYSDTGIYFEGGVQSVWTDPLRTVGYSMFLRVLHGISPHLLLVTLVQHLLGLITAALYFLMVRRCGGPRWLGLVPATVIALFGDQLFIEHAALSDALFIFLVAVTLYCTIRARPPPRPAPVTRAPPVEPALVCRVRLRGRVGRLGPGGRPCSGTGARPLARLHPRPADPAQPADRRRFTARRLRHSRGLHPVASRCDRTQRPDHERRLADLRPGGAVGRLPLLHTAGRDPSPLPVHARSLSEGGPGRACYVFSSASPAWQLIGPPYDISKDPYAMRRLLEFSESAVAGEPGEYLYAVWRDTIRLFDPEASSFGDLSAQGLINFMLYGPDGHSGNNEFVTYWQNLLYPHDGPEHRGNTGPLRTWEKLTRITGLWMAVLLVLVLAAPWLSPRGLRSSAVLFGVVGLVLLFFPILTTAYDYRYTIPAVAPLFAASAISAWGLWLRLRARRLRRVA